MTDTAPKTKPRWIRYATHVLAFAVGVGVGMAINPGCPMEPSGEVKR
jgi:hypothetical protein